MTMRGWSAVRCSLSDLQGFGEGPEGDCEGPAVFRWEGRGDRCDGG